MNKRGQTIKLYIAGIIVENLTLLTVDKIISEYNVDIFAI